MKKFFLGICVCLLPAILFAEQKSILTVMDFKTNSVSKAEMQAVVSQLSNALFQTGKYRIIDSSQRDMLLEELEFSLSDCTDKSCQLQAGKLLSAEFIVTGELELPADSFPFPVNYLKQKAEPCLPLTRHFTKIFRPCLKTFRKSRPGLAEQKKKPTLCGP